MQTVTSHCSVTRLFSFSPPFLLIPNILFTFQATTEGRNPVLSLLTTETHSKTEMPLSLPAQATQQGTPASSESKVPGLRSGGEHCGIRSTHFLAHNIKFSLWKNKGINKSKAKLLLSPILRVLSLKHLICFTFTQLSVTSSFRGLSPGTEKWPYSPET